VTRCVFFLYDIEDIINSRRAAIKQLVTGGRERTLITEQRIKVLKDFANDLRLAVLRLMLDREESSEHPKAKLVVRLNRGYS